MLPLVTPADQIGAGLANAEQRETAEQPVATQMFTLLSGPTITQTSTSWQTGPLGGCVDAD